MKNKKIYLKKLSPALIILLIAASVSTVIAENGASQAQQIGQTNQNTSMQDNSNSSSADSSEAQDSQVPGVSDNATQYNKPDDTPKGETYQVRAQEQTVFEYRNMTMVMNCTQNCDVTLSADQEVTPKILGLNVDPNQTMTLTMNLTKSPLNGAMVNERNLNFYLGIEPDEALQLQAQIRVYVDQNELNEEMNREVDASRLTWMYWNQEQAQWESVESYYQNGYLVCNTDHFSTWTVAEQTVEEEQSTAQNSDLQVVFIATTVIAVAVVVGTVAYKKRK